MSDAQTLELLEALGRRVANLEILESVQSNADLDFAIPSVTLGLADAIGTLDTLLRSDATLISQHLGIGVGVAPTADRIRTLRNDASIIPTLLIEQDGAGDAAQQFLETGGQAWTMGMDNSAFNAFIIAGGADLATNPFLAILATGRTGLGTVLPRFLLHLSDGSASGLTAAAGNGLMITEAGTARLYFEDTGEGAGDRVMVLYHQDEFLTIGSTTDTGAAFDQQYILRISRDGNVGLNTASPDANFQNVGDTKLGDDDTNYMFVGLTGDVTFVGGAGLLFGHMYVELASPITVAITVNVIAEVENAAQDGWVAGELNEVTFPGGGTEHYLTISEPGRYEINWDMSIMTTVGSGGEIHGGIMVDSVAVRNQGEAHRTISAANDSGSISGHAILDLPKGTDEISLWLLNTSNNNDVVVDHGNLVVIHIGGT